MKKKLFNIHKLIGINVLLFFFVALFFGILTIFQPYVSFWEDKKQHIKDVAIEEINLNKCFKQITRRTYTDEFGKKMSNDFIKIQFPSKEVKATNLIRVKNRPNFYLDPTTCKRVRPNSFSIATFFNKIHTGSGIFNSLVMRIVFGFMSVAVVFLSLSGLYLIIKNSYRNSKTKTVKGFFAKYHRLLLLYSLPLVFMFGLTGALFNLGVYSSPIITNYLTNGKTSNVLTVDRNILVDPDLEKFTPSQQVKTINLNRLYLEAKKALPDVTFYEMQVYNFNDIKSRVKFIGYEPKNFFISSMGNESYVVLNGTTGKTIKTKVAQEGSFTEKTLDAIFYLHYLRTFTDIPRILFGIICIAILFGVTCAFLLWLQRSKQNSRNYKIVKPISFTLILGSFVSSALLFATTWAIPKGLLHFTINNTIYHTQEILFYLSYLIVFVYVIIQRDIYKSVKHMIYLTALLLLVAVTAHGMNSGYSIITSYMLELNEIFYMDCILTIIALVLIYGVQRVQKTFFDS